jgi:hypothetical protein
MTPDPAALVALSAADCTFCARNQKMLRELQASGQHYVTAPVQITEVVPFDGAPEGEQYYQARFKQVGALVVDTRARTVRTDRRISGYCNVVVRWASDRWVLVGVEHA